MQSYTEIYKQCQKSAIISVNKTPVQTVGYQFMNELHHKNWKHSTSAPATDTPFLLFLQPCSTQHFHHLLELTALSHCQGPLYHKERKIRKSGLGTTETSMINSHLTKLANRKAKDSCRLYHIPVKH